MSSEESTEGQIFGIVQNFLKDTPVIIWGSGATIPYGLPSMNKLKKNLKPVLGEISETANLELELGNIDDPTKIDETRRIIRNEILKKDIAFLRESIKNINHFDAVSKMIKKFYNTHPQIVNIVTTNYDRVLEYVLSRGNYNYTDGFTGKTLSKFQKSLFEKKEEVINLIKVHGSLNWVNCGGDSFFLPHDCKIDGLKGTMILPSRNKHEEAYKEPYRTLITKSDEVIEAAKSFLVVGFGFNDEHLTPKIEGKIRQDTPIVVITEKATESCIKKLHDASKYCLLEHGENGTKVTYKKGADCQHAMLEKDYWKLNEFIGVLGT